MTNRTPVTRCHATLGATLVAMLTVAAATRVAAETPAYSRVRSDHPTIAALILEGRDRSTTFRSLADTIDATDGIVYIQDGTCGHGVRACLILSVTVAGPNRILHVLVDTRRASWDLIGAIGHEMRHAVEVLSDPSIRSRPAIYFFYQQHSSGGRQAFETDAAIRAGLDVRAEVRWHSSTERPGSKPEETPH